ncbi:MAG: IgGFc-binding protein, partial [Tannerella sp.]|nr:IgGFc-binding protein [Tannerella sp.]
MKKKLLSLFISLLSLTAIAQDTEFWFAPFSVYDEATSSAYRGHSGFVINNPTHRQATVTIHHYKDDSDITLIIPAYGYQQYSYTYADLQAKVEVPNGTHLGLPYTGGIKITSNIGVVIYYIYDYQAQQETALLKGGASLGKSFHVTSSRGGNIRNTSSLNVGYGYYPYISIMGTEANTAVTFTIPVAVTGFSAGTHTVTLNEGEILNLRTSSVVLAGSIVTSDKPIVVTSGEECRNSISGACDQCADQLVTDHYAANVYVLTLSGGFRNASNYNSINNYVEIIGLENGTNVEIDWGSGLTSLCTLNKGQTFVSDTFKVNRANACATIKSSHPIHIMQNTGHEATTCHLPNFYGTNTHKTSFFTYWETFNNMYPSVMLVYREGSKEDFIISYPGQTDTPLFDWITANARWIDSEGDVPQFTGWKYIRFTLPDAAINQIVSINNNSSVFQLGFTSSFNYGTNLTYFSAFNSDFSFDPDTVWTCPGIYTNLIGGIAEYYKWIFPDGTIKEGASMNSVKAVQMGMYILEMTQGFNTIT